MIINKIRLVNFRSHFDYELKCEKMTTLILGENGVGKTSILEALYLVLRGNSFRVNDAELVRRGADSFLVEVEYFNGLKVFVKFENNKKIFIIKDKKFNRMPKNEKYPVVLFLPDDLNLINAGKSEKRSYFDKFFSQLSEEYYVNLVKYTKVIKQRNVLLKNREIKMEEIFPWNILLSRYSVLLEKIRREYIEEINSRVSEKYFAVSGVKDKIEIKLNSEIIDSRQVLSELENKFLIDKITGRTNFGAHRDSYDFLFNRVLADGSASRGETRSMILALKFIEAEMLEEKTRKIPVVLLDDVLSELDKNRQESLKKNFSKNQVIMTSIE